MTHKVNPTVIQQALNPVIGLPLWSIGRAANLLWLDFGEKHTVPAWKGGTKTVGDWAIHVQCAWRICQRGHIVVARSDYYYYYYYSPDGDDLDDDWDSPGKSRFDSVVAMILTEIETNPPIVNSVEPDDVGGFQLNLATGFRLDVFPASSDESVEH